MAFHGESFATLFCEILLLAEYSLPFWLKLSKADLRYRQPQSPKEHRGICQVLMTYKWCFIFREYIKITVKLCEAVGCNVISSASDTDCLDSNHVASFTNLTLGKILLLYQLAVK